MFTTNNRVKRRPSPYEMEITDGESTCLSLCTHPSCWLEPQRWDLQGLYTTGVSRRWVGCLGRRVFALQLTWVKGKSWVGLGGCHPHAPGKRVHGSEDTLQHLAQISRVSCSPHCSSISTFGKNPRGRAEDPQGFLAPPPKSFLESGVCSLPGIGQLRPLS